MLSEGVFSGFALTKASVHDIHYLKDVKLSHQNCVILADKGYLSRNYQPRFIRVQPHQNGNSYENQSARL
jgi:hypothetical protein